MTLAPGGDRLNVALCTREFPPDVYGGAGVHVEYLAKELSNYVNLTVECQGAERSTAVAHQPWDRLRDINSALQTISTELSMVADMNNADLQANYISIDPVTAVAHILNMPNIPEHYRAPLLHRE